MVKQKNILIYGSIFAFLILGNLVLIQLHGGFAVANAFPARSPERLGLAVAMAAWTFTICCFGTIAYIDQTVFGFLHGEKEQQK